MSVDPLKSHSLPQADAGRLGASASARRSDAAAGDTPSDPVSMSGEKPSRRCPLGVT